MHRVDTATAVATLPTQNPAGTPGYFTQGSSTGSPPATVPGQDWFNTMQEEPMALLAAAGITPDKADNTQWLQAIIAIAQMYGFKTGDAKFTYNNVADTGWLLADDGSIGNAASGATARANADCSALFAVLWNNIPDQWCPVYDSSGVKAARGANAAADFAANRRLRLSRTLGRAIAIAGLGRWEEIFTADAGTDVLTVPSNKSLYTGATVGLSNSGGALPGGLPATAYWIRLSDTTGKVATSLANAHDGTAIDITSAGTGTHTLTMSLTSRALGEHAGEETHSNTADENGPHTHTKTGFSSGGSGTASIVTSDATSHTVTMNYSGLGTPHNIVSPETFMNVMIKL